MLGDGSLWALPSDSLLDLFRSYLNDPLDKRRGQRVIGCEPDDSLAGVKRGEFIPQLPDDIALHDKQGHMLLRRAEAHQVFYAVK